MCKKLATCVIIRVSNFGGEKMKKGKVRYILKNNDLVTEFEGNCLFHEDKNILIYKEENGMDILIELDRLILTRENKEMFLLLDFYGGDSYVLMKELDKKMPLFVTVHNKELKDNHLFISYSLTEGNIFDFEIEWILGGD